MNTPYTEGQKQEFKRQFKARRTRQMVLIVPMILLAIGLAFIRDGKTMEIAGFSSNTLGIAFLVIVVGVVAFTIKNWRCPACNGYLGRTISPRFCQKCGVELGS